MRAILSQMDQAMITQAQAATLQAQSIMTQHNRDVAPRPHYQVTTMDFRLRDFTWMNPPTFYGSKVDEDPQEFLDDVYKVLYDVGVNSSEKDDIQSKRPNEPFVIGVLEDLQEECQSAMLHDNINISRLMIYGRRAEEALAKRKSRDAKRARSFDGASSKNRIDIQDKPKFKKRGLNQVPTKFPRASGDRVSNPKFKKERGSNSPNDKPTSGKCGKNHYGECLKGIDNCFSCGKSGHKIKDCPNLKSQDKGSDKAQASGSSDAPKKNHFYALRSRDEKETSPDVVTGMLKIFTLDVYALLDRGATLSFVTPLVDKKFDILPDILH
ncbi:uncharacterized protein [Solanum lycopersicum]|uniref:uncharacterized protein n=1 Tax=Solanum lycopersicum TaxID=4081 RepID=UPI003748682E